MRFVASAICLFILLAGCNGTQPIEKYQMVASPNGTVYRLDKTSGEVWVIKDSIMQEVHITRIGLKVNQRYTGEDLYSFTYLGKGLFGEIKTLDEFFRDPKDPLGILSKDSSLSQEDWQAFQWARQNPNDPRAKRILELLRNTDQTKRK